MTGSTLVALTVAGIVSPFLLQVLKKWLQWDGFKALALTAFTSVAIALVAMWSTGEINSGREVFLSISSVFGLTQLVFKGFKEAGVFTATAP